MPEVALLVNNIPKGNNIKVDNQLPNKVEIALSSDKLPPIFDIKK